MTEQILAIAPILPGQKPRPEFEIPPHSSTSTTHNEKKWNPNQPLHVPPTDQVNDLIDFNDLAANDKAVAANRNQPPEPRHRSTSLMDDDHHINAMNNQMGNMKLMEPTKTATSPAPRNEIPLKRTDTQTSEAESFFDAQP